MQRAVLPRRTVRLPLGAFALFILAAPFGCKQDTGSAYVQKSQTLYLFNPFADQGGAPYFHGSANSWSLSPMKAFECGWYQYGFSGGDFRFMMGDNWSHVELGAQHGLCSPSDDCSMDSFNVDSMLATSTEIWIWLDQKSGKSMVATSRPFDCSPDGQTLDNPYGRGQLPSLARKNQAKDLLAVWKSKFYEESGNLARVKFDDPAYTVSEGIGYGMLVFAFADDGGAERSNFDKLFATYGKFDDGSGLMHWKVKGFDSVAESNAASDADLDVAVALFVAHKRWGEPKNDNRYFDAAKKLMAAIKNKEFNAGGYLKPGDAWDAAKNPSYFSFVAFELFRKNDTDQKFWTDVIDRHYALLLSARNGSTGLVPNWTDEKGGAANPGTGYPNWDAFGFDAIRVPWRVAWAYLWYGGEDRHSRARDLALGFCRFFKSNLGGDSAKVRNEFSTSGSRIGDDVPAGPGVVGAYAAGCAVDSAESQTLDAAYAGAMGKTAEYDVTYYQTTLKLLEVLLLTGQSMPIP